MRRFVVLGQRARASPDFSLEDLPSTSGRADVLLRCLRAALLYSHGLRRDTRVYLVLLGGPSAPRTVRVEGSEVRFLRPDERALATLLRKTLAAFEALSEPPEALRFVTVRPGLSVARGGLDAVLAEPGARACYVLEPGGEDLRAAPLALGEALFFLGDHHGFTAEDRALLRAEGARALSVGPVAVHAEDALALLVNELDRRVSP